MAPIILYTTKRSPPSFDVLSVVEVLGLNIEERSISLINKDHLTPEFLKINPQHTVPTLIDGDFILWDSQAINCYLVDKYGKTDFLYPKNLEQRALVNQRLHFNSSILYTRIRNLVNQVQTLKKDVVNREDIDEVLKGYDFLEAFLRASEWAAGNEVTLADISLTSSISVLNKFIPFDETKYPKILAWSDKCKALPFYKYVTNSEGEILGNKIKQAVENTLASK